MIVGNNRHYYGLHLLDTAVTDIDPKSPNYLRIADLPVQLTSGRNLIKLYGNSSVFLPGSVLYVEVLDSNGKVIYSEIPDFTDSGKRKLLIIEVDDDVAPGPALITVVSALKNELVPSQYRNRVNFKWQTQINVVKYESNTTEIIYETPPEVLLQTRIRPFVTTSFRNNEETSTREYGDYEFWDYGFDDYIGDTDGSGNIFQKDKAYKQLTSFTSASISSFNRNNVFYLKEENFSAKSINRNYPDLLPGKGFYIQFGDSIVRDGTVADSNLSTTPWILDGISGADYTISLLPGHGYAIRKNVADVATFRYFGQSLPLEAGNYYLVSFYYNVNRPFDIKVNLGYSYANQSGSISTYVTNSFTTVGSATASFVLRASDGGPYLWIGSRDSAPGTLYFDDIQVRPLTSLGYDFKHETDIIGGYVKVPRPNISPNYSSGYVIMPTYTPSGIISGSTAYTSYIDFILQEKDAAVDNRFKYQIIPEYQINVPTSYTPTQHKIDVFTSSPLINYTSIDGISFAHSYAREFSFNDPLNHSHPLTMINGPGFDLYGICFVGGPSNNGGIYKYNTDTDQFSILYSFPGAPGGAKPNETPVLVSNNIGRKLLIGTTGDGGKFKSGSIYSYDVDNNIITYLHSFGRPSSSGHLPVGPIMQASNGLLYGTTNKPEVPGQGYGVIYSYNTASGVYTVVHQTGSYGNTNLIEHRGELWGTTADGGIGGNGSIFRFNFSTNTLVHEHNFAVPETPNGLTMVEPGVFYLATRTGNKIYKYVSGSGSPPTQVASLNATTGTGPEKPPLVDSNHLYLTTYTDGANSVGTVIVVDLSDPLPATPTVIHDFDAAPDGNRPKSTVLRIGNSLYGTTTFGGDTNNNGSIFRIDRTGIFRPYVEESSGIIYHRNSIVPYEIPATSNLIEDYPRWTGPVIVGGSDNLYSIIELEIRNLEPLTGDISKVQLYAKPKGVRSEFVDLGIYPTTPVDVLLDNNYVNHVQFIDSPYRLTGYFKPTITKTTEANLESFPFETNTFASGWVTGSITGSYFKNETFHTFISLSATPESNATLGSSLKFVLNAIPTDNSLAYAVYTASSIPAIKEESDIWQQLSYNLFSAAPFQMNMDLSSSNYYTSSYAAINANLNSVLMYAGLVAKTGSINIKDIFAVSPDLNANYDPTGSSVSASSFAHPLTFNGKLGWKTDTFFIPSDVAVTQSLYPALFFEYNTKNHDLLDNTIDDSYPHVVEISNLSCREVGDRDYIRDKYWNSYTYTKDTGFLITSASVTSNTDVLADSAKLSVIDGVTGISSSRALGYLNNNKLVFQTIDSYKFYKNVPYIISFNAVSKIGPMDTIMPEELGDSNFSVPWTCFTPNNLIQEFGYWLQVHFDSAVSSPIQVFTGLTYSGTHLIELTTGAFEHYSLDNPISLNVSFLLSGDSQTINDIKPFTTYKFRVVAGLNDSDPIFTFTAASVDSNTKVYVTGVSVKRLNYDFVTRNFVSQANPSKSKLRVFGLNSTFGVPFADQLATPEIGEFIGELEHKKEFSEYETKNFGRIEMEFEAETDGFGYIAFESDLGAEWYISDISVKPKDRIGSTPGVTRLFVKIPNDLVNKPLTFKVEYLNDIDQKAPYNTILNDVVFSNVNEQQSGTNSSVNTSLPPTTTGNSNTSGPNSTAVAE